jgi:HEAT repeat protein
VAATSDESREVRIAAAAGLATLGSDVQGAQGGGAVNALVADPDPLVRAAALTALSELGCSADEFGAIEKALQAPAWQVREGAVRALSGAVAELSVPAISGLAHAIGDAHLDEPKAAVLSLTRWAGEPAARDALDVALKDSDADVRAYARRALEREAG